MKVFVSFSYMESLFEKGSREPMKLHEDEVGKAIWDIPKEEEAEPGHDEYEEEDEDFEIPPLLPRSQEVGIHAPGFDSLQQQEWEERERGRREEEAERKKRENPRGHWEME